MIFLGSWNGLCFSLRRNCNTLLKARIGKTAVYGIDPPKESSFGSGHIDKYNGFWNCIPRVLPLRVLFRNSDFLHLQT